MVGNISQEIMRTIESLSINALKDYKKSFLHWSKPYLLIRINKLEESLDRGLSCSKCDYERIEVIEEFIFTLNYRFKHYYGILHKIDSQLALLEKIEAEIVTEYL